MTHLRNSVPVNAQLVVAHQCTLRQYDSFVIASKVAARYGQRSHSKTLNKLSTTKTVRVATVTATATATVDYIERMPDSNLAVCKKRRKHSLVLTMPVSPCFVSPTPQQKFSASLRKCKLTATCVTQYSSNRSRNESKTFTAMVLLQQQKRNAADNSNPLLAFGVLQHVLSYVGSGHHFFVAPVSKPWRDLYATLESQQLAVYDEFSSENISITCVPEMTLYSCLFRSSSQVKLAHDVAQGAAFCCTALLCSSENHAYARPGLAALLGA
eukprot:5194-Heterococcus_DN1.PRE.1